MSTPVNHNTDRHGSHVRAGVPWVTHACGGAMGHASAGSQPWVTHLQGHSHGSHMRTGPLCPNGGHPCTSPVHPLYIPCTSPCPKRDLPCHLFHSGQNLL